MLQSIAVISVQLIDIKHFLSFAKKWAKTEISVTNKQRKTLGRRDRQTDGWTYG